MFSRFDLRMNQIVARLLVLGAGRNGLGHPDPRELAALIDAYYDGFFFGLWRNIDNFAKHAIEFSTQRFRFTAILIALLVIALALNGAFLGYHAWSRARIRRVTGELTKLFLDVKRKQAKALHWRARKFYDFCAVSSAEVLAGAADPGPGIRRFLVERGGRVRCGLPQGHQGLHPEQGAGLAAARAFAYQASTASSGRSPASSGSSGNARSSSR